MLEKRTQIRMLCAELVEIHYRDRTNRTRRLIANLEDISLSGACVQLDLPLPHNTEVRILHPKGELKGVVRYCVYREIGYFLGVEFQEGSRWSLRQFRPAHLLDPRRLVNRVTGRLARNGFVTAAPETVQ